MSTFEVDVVMGLTLKAGLDIPFGSSLAKDKDVKVDGLNVDLAGQASTDTPPMAMGAAFSLTLVGGAGTLDLTAIPGITGVGTQDGSGKKLNGLLLFNPTGNGVMTLSCDVANFYNWSGNDSNSKLILSPGDRFMLYRNDTGPDVDGTHKNIKVDGTGTQSLHVEVVLG